MPSIEAVFETFPDEDLLIHIRSYSVETGEVLWSFLSKMSEERLDKITIYGSCGRLITSPKNLYFQFGRLCRYKAAVMRAARIKNEKGHPLFDGLPAFPQKF